ncbi:MAG: hypothetical protein NW206_09045 [Hyphomonadaceae bacterium]|nr:hypothetical protein [Hyphomonadaceae bacterium]
MMRICLVVIAAMFTVAQASAQEQSPESIPEGVVNAHPVVSVERVDFETLRARRIDVVDSQGVIRLTLAGELPNPVVDGVEWSRSTPVSGLIVRDDQGNERGGFGFASGPNAVVLALDHNNGEAAGFNTLPDGSANLMLIARPAPTRSAALGDRLIPGGGPTPVQVSVTPEGAPILVLNDTHDRPRIRIQVSAEGYGMIEFLDADGRVIEQVAPERDRDQRRGRR